MSAFFSTRQYGNDWSYDTLVRCRKFYQAYEHTEIVATMLPQLEEDANIYAQQYTLYLPDKTLLKNKLREWVAEFNEKEERK